MFWYVQEVVLILPEVGLPPALGQCRGQPGELKNHSLDGFSLAYARTFPSNPNSAYYKNKKQAI